MGSRIAARVLIERLRPWLTIWITWAAVTPMPLCGVTSQPEGTIRPPRVLVAGSTDWLASSAAVAWSVTCAV
jgi:hypothetical protein